MTDIDHYTPEKTIAALFGDLCSSKEFSHDIEMRQNYPEKFLPPVDNAQDDEEELETQQRSFLGTTSPMPETSPPPLSSSFQKSVIVSAQAVIDLTSDDDEAPPPSSQRAFTPDHGRTKPRSRPAPPPRSASSKKRRLEQRESSSITEGTLYPSAQHCQPSTPPLNATPPSHQPPPPRPKISTPTPALPSAPISSAPTCDSDATNVTMLPLISTTETAIPSDGITPKCSQDGESIATCSQGSCDSAAIEAAAWAALNVEGWSWARDIRLKSLIREGGQEVEL